MWYEGVSISGSMFEISTETIYVIIIVLSIFALLLLIDVLRDSVEEMRLKSNYHYMMELKHEYRLQNVVEQIRSEITPTGKILVIACYAGLRKPVAITAVTFVAWGSYVIYVLKMENFLSRCFSSTKNLGRSFGDSDPDSL